MLAIGRALMASWLLLLDEPSLGLAPKLVEDILPDYQDHQPGGHYRSCWWSKMPIRPAYCALWLCVGDWPGDADGRGQKLLQNDHVRRSYLGE